MHSIFFAIVFSFLAAPAVVFGQATYNFPTFGETVANSPDTFVKLVYEYAIALSAIAGLVAFTIAGVQYLIAAGDRGRVEDAKDRLLHALLGLLVIAFAGILLKFINPSFLTFGEVALPGSIIQRTLPGSGEFAGGYLRCQSTDDGSYCARMSGNCGDDSQCPPCLSLAEGAPCTPASPDEGPDLAYLACVPDEPCLAAAQGGSCAPEYPCSTIAGGSKSSFAVVPDDRCALGAIMCMDDFLFSAPDHVCCAAVPSGPETPSGAPEQEALRVSCYARPETPAAGVQVSFGISANGTGAYDCAWSGSFEQAGCEPEVSFDLAGTYGATVDVVDIGSSQRAQAACWVVITP